MDKIHFYPFNVLLPDKISDKWPVIACDQYTSDPEYWDRLSEFVGDAPSTLRMIVPEAYLKDNVDERIHHANQAMEEYLDKGVFKQYNDSMVYVERMQSNGQIRRGIVGTIDLDDYVFKGMSECLVRPTEEVVISRIPPRLRVREHAVLETSHVLLLIADPDNTVIESVRSNGVCKSNLQELYNITLQPDGGSVAGYQLEGEAVKLVQDGLNKLVKDNLLFLVGDGNHSIATAKEYYESHKDNKLARYTMVEIINLCDKSLIFEPIHRVLFNADGDEVIKALMDYYPGTVLETGEGHVVEFVYDGRCQHVTIPLDVNPLAVGAIQRFLDDYESSNNCEIDYIHDAKEVREIGTNAHNVGVLLPDINIDGLLDYIKTKGRLPRKTFSIGDQQDKKYYMECRKIKY